MENKIHVWNHQPVKDRSMATMWLSLTCWRLTSIPSEYVSENDEVASVSGRKATMKNHWRHNKIASITNSLYWPINHYLSFISWGFRRPSTRTALVCLLHWHVDHRRGLDQFQQHSDAHSDDHECIYCIYIYVYTIIVVTIIICYLWSLLSVMICIYIYICVICVNTMQKYMFLHVIIIIHYNIL